MRCHYEVLGVTQNATNEELKKAYRKMALQWHPDKNLEQLEEAKKQFQLVQAAYETLSDPQERAFYDRNRDSFLRDRGTGGSAKSSQNIDLYEYFSSQCYSGFNDSEKGFYTVYRQLFERIAVNDLKYMDEEDDIIIPSFGHSDMDLEDVARFYSFWSGYCTSMAFEWADEFDIREAHQMGRWVEKKIEKENNKARQKARKQFNEEVRALVAFVRKRDKRWQERKKVQAAKAEEKAKRQKEAQAREREERNKQMEESIQQERENMAAYEEQLREMEARFAKEWGISESEESDYEDEETTASHDVGDGVAEVDGEEDIAEYLMDNLYCVACNKTFKTERAMENHERSKKHRENIEALKVTMLAENKLMEEEQPVENTSRLADSGSADDETTTASMPKSRKKKKKKKQSSTEDVTPPTTSTSKGGGKSKKKKRQQLILEDSSDSTPDTEKLDCSDRTTINGHENSEDSSQIKDVEDKESKEVKEQSDQEVTSKPKKGKKAKEERKRAREANATSKPPEAIELRCTICGAEFSSKNKLFGHIKTEGHAALKTDNPQTGKRGKARAK
ncbi:dnaJ homolog subfamily C member 21-like [Palaemon carinicauda]|uniref:dnaJ homolog subfamily C member 21-like n=1 Tax=Palaemon carinicauda TaxID=392227 RepID=UPI0035B64835